MKTLHTRVFEVPDIPGYGPLSCLERRVPGQRRRYGPVDIAVVRISTAVVLPRAFTRETSDLALWDLAGIPIVVENPSALQNAEISPLWRSPLYPTPPDPTCFAHERARS